jgi:hypothetical protein
VKHKEALLNRFISSMKANGVFLVVEYDRQASNPWVPYPLTINAAQVLFKNVGYPHFHLLNKRESAFGRYDMYSAMIGVERFASG